MEIMIWIKLYLNEYLRNGQVIDTRNNLTGLLYIMPTPL